MDMSETGQITEVAVLDMVIKIGLITGKRFS
jgi:hypothetical protein